MEATEIREINKRLEIILTLKKKLIIVFSVYVTYELHRQTIKAVGRIMRPNTIKTFFSGPPCD